MCFKQSPWDLKMMRQSKIQFQFKVNGCDNKTNLTLIQGYFWHCFCPRALNCMTLQAILQVSLHYLVWMFARCTDIWLLIEGLALIIHCCSDWYQADSALQLFGLCAKMSSEWTLTTWLGSPSQTATSCLRLIHRNVDAPACLHVSSRCLLSWLPHLISLFE